MKHYYLAAISFFCYISCNPKESDMPSQWNLQLDTLLTAEHESNRFDGTILIGDSDSILYSKAIGSANRVWDIPLQLNHRFDICSISKSFIAALVLMAVEEGKISLDDLLIDQLRAHPYQGSFDNNITIHQMLTHTSGLADYEDVDSLLVADQFKLFKRLHFSNGEYVDFISKLAEKNQPGRQFYYSNFSYHLLIILLEDLYQQPFSNFSN